MLQVIKDVALVGLVASTLMFSACVLKLIIEGMKREVDRHASSLKMTLGASLLLAVSIFMLVS
jgi:hypothetical protein